MNTVKPYLEKLPKGLNILGFEMALMMNFNYAPDRERLKSLFYEYEDITSPEDVRNRTGGSNE